MKKHSSTNTILKTLIYKLVLLAYMSFSQANKKMSPDNAPSFYDWNQSFKKKPETENGTINKPVSFDSFITIFPAWELKRKYALIRINERTFKLFERGNRNVEKGIESLLSVFLYLNPSGYNKRMQKIHNQVYENKKDFKEKWDTKLEVYER